MLSFLFIYFCSGLLPDLSIYFYGVAVGGVGGRPSGRTHSGYDPHARAIPRGQACGRAEGHDQM